MYPLFQWNRSSWWEIANSHLLTYERWSQNRFVSEIRTKEANQSCNKCSLKFPPEEPCQPEFDIANFKVDTIFISLTIIIFFSLYLHDATTQSLLLPHFCSVISVNPQLSLDLIFTETQVDDSTPVIQCLW